MTTPSKTWMTDLLNAIGGKEDVVPEGWASVMDVMEAEPGTTYPQIKCRMNRMLNRGQLEKKIFLKYCGGNQLRRVVYYRLIDGGLKRGSLNGKK